MSNYNDYLMYISDGRKSLTQISQAYKMSVNAIIDANRREQNGLVVNRYLSSLKPNEPVMEGLLIRIPQRISGGIDDNLNRLIEQQTSNIVNDDARLATIAEQDWRTVQEGNSDTSRRFIDTPVSSDEKYSKFGCYFYLLYKGKRIGKFNTPEGKVYYLPVFPQEVSESYSGGFNPVPIFGRSVNYQIYTGSDHSISLSLDMHEELVDDYEYLHELVGALASACYPEYTEGIVEPPEIVLVIGKQLKIRGVLTECSPSWSVPIIDGQLVHCQVSLSITETTGPYSASEVRKMKAYHN